MSAAWILLAVAAAFTTAALWRRTRRGSLDSAARIWLRVALIFVGVAAWLLWRQA
jgi:hypothetical protein